MPRKDLKGQRFNRLTVLQLDTEKTNKQRSYWICKCDCGKIKSIRSDQLTSGKTKSCGCLNTEKGVQKWKRANRKAIVPFIKKQCGSGFPEPHC